MRLARLVLVVAAVASLATQVLPANAYERPGVTYRASVASDGTQANGASAIDQNAQAGRAALSANGRYVAFGSSATNLVPGDTNGFADVFVHDAVRRTTVRVSVSSAGAQGTEAGIPAPPGTPPLCSALQAPKPGASSFDSPVGSPTMSANGKLVAFASCFTNLVAGDTNAASDVFVHSLSTGATTRVSVTSAGRQSAYSSWGGSVSDDGRIVVFTSQGALDPAGSSCSQPPVLLDVVPGLCSDGTQVYARDTKTGRTSLVSATPNRAAGNGASLQASVSGDGRYVVFVSTATNLVSGQSAASANPPAEVYLRDLKRATTRLISVGVDGAASNQRCDDPSDTHGSVEHAMSADDRFVVFTCLGTNLVPNYGPATHAGMDVYVRDLRSGRVERVSVDSAGGTINQELQPSLSRDGRYTVFYAGNPDGFAPYAWQAQVVLHDSLTGASEFVSVPVNGDVRPQPTTPASLGPDVSADGRHVAFASQAANLVQADTNGFPDVFVRDRGRGLGVGELARAGRLTVGGATGFSSTRLVSAISPLDGLNEARTAAGATLIRATMVYRASSADLFTRLDLKRMPTFAVANPAVVYGLDLTVGDNSYEVRAAKTGIDASFGLFRRDFAGRWVHIADLHGGYGTTGQEVVLALPLADIGAQHGGRITGLTAFTALGTYVTGATRLLDTLHMSR